MMTIVRAYRFACDWAACWQSLTLHGQASADDAKEKARMQGWTISKVRGTPDRVRCPRHAYAFVRKPTGRPKRRVA
jgi:hypothetical protein